ncbi:TonB-dependent siderophore receptor [Aestuariibacter sp. AA17]|uniref:TonB-dependent siderophore receptor n=1 Tax=Fluctibacter corallii TaxID=2984329 RepID=A0ABT3AAH1_9ALTE|nr:TonB-dependent siderophore receptor [Aestuariibacter sp. AA17]MCV2885674.1 TonB-dependent siderophore receptor [Aestuariibacter sp. AA17]
MEIKKTHIAFALSLALTGAVNAQDNTKLNQQAPDAANNMETIEVIGTPNKFGALKSDTPIMETARSVSIETFDSYMAKGALSLDDALTYSSGVTAETFGFSTRGDFIQIRGFDAPEYRDGMQSLSGNYNNTRPEIYTLEQVEVLKGPASVLFGPGSPGGLVNIVTKRPTALGTNEVMLEAGSFGRGQIATDLHFASGDEKLLGRFVGLYRESDTQIDEINDDSLVIAPSFTYQFSDDTQVTILADYTKRKSDSAHQFLPLTGTLYPSASGQEISNTAYFGQPGFNQFDTESWAITLLAEHQINDTWSVDLSSRYRDGESEYKQAWVSFLGAGTPRIDQNGNGARSWYISNGFSDQFQVDARARASFATGNVEHQLLIGVSNQRIDNRNDRSNLYGVDFSTGLPIPVGGIINVFNPVYGAVPELPAVTRGTETEDTIWGLYLHDQISIGDWVLNAGVRFDDVEKSVEGVKTDEKETSISVSALYQFDSGLSPYINYSESFAPKFGIDEISKQALKPEKGQQIEAGIKYQPTGTSHLVTLAVFDIELENLANPNDLPNAPTQQEGVSEVQGIEIEADLRFDVISVEANFNWLDSEDPNGNERSSIPKRTASVWTMYEPSKEAGFNAGMGIRYVDNSYSTQGLVHIVTPSYSVIDLKLGYRLEDWDLSLNVRNLGDREYYSTCLARGDCFPGEERNITARAVYSF